MRLAFEASRAKAIVSLSRALGTARKSYCV